MANVAVCVVVAAGAVVSVSAGSLQDVVGYVLYGRCCIAVVVDRDR